MGSICWCTTAYTRWPLECIAGEHFSNTTTTTTTTTNNSRSNTLPFWSCSAHNGWQACGGHQGRAAFPSGRSWSPGCTRGGPRWWTFPRHPPPSLWTEWWQRPVTNEYKNDGSDDMSCTSKATSLSDDSALWEWTQKWSISWHVTSSATSLSDDSTLWEWTQEWCISWHVTSSLWVMTVTSENEHRSGILADMSLTSNATSLSDASALWEWTQEWYISWHVTYIQCHISECWQHCVKRNICMVYQKMSQTPISLSDDSALWEWTQKWCISWHVTYIQCHSEDSILWEWI